MYMMTRLNTDIKIIYNTQCKILKKLSNDITSIVIDKKRQISKQEKEEIWNESRSIKEFDQMYL